MTSPCSQRRSVDRGETRELPAETLEEAGPPEEQRVAAEVKSDATAPPAVKERELDRLRPEAYRKAQEIIGKADAEAARIYAEAYGQDPEFYAFYQTLDAYKQTLQKKASLLLTTGSDFYRYLKSVNGVVPHATAKEGKP